MSLNKKIIIALYFVLFVGVLFSSVFLIRASVLDKQNYMYDLQLSNGEMIINTLKNKTDLSDEKLEEELNTVIENLSGLSDMGVGLFYKNDSRATIFKKAKGELWPVSIEIPNNYWQNLVATSSHRGGLIRSVLPIDSERALIIVSKDDHVFDMLLSYLKKTLPLILLIMAIVGVFGWFFATRLTKPIENLNLSTKELAKGKWSIQVPNTSTTEINQLVDSFNRLGGQLYEREQEVLAKERLSALGTFSAGMAHELKNPLNIISSYSQLLQRKLEDGSKEKKHVDIIYSEVHRATRIINDLMNFSRQKSLVVKPASVSSFLEELDKNFNFIEKNKQISLSLASQDCESFNIDEDLFFQVVINLVENATHVLEENEIENPKIDVKIYKDTDNVFVSIKDNGPGIPEEIIQKIFEPFYTTKIVGKGTGLGLAYCQGIVQQHEGVLKVKSRPGETEFIITIPT